MCIDMMNSRHNIKPIWNSFQGDYKDNFMWFACLHFFLYQIIFSCIVHMVTSASINVNKLLLLIMGFFVAISLLHMLTMQLKNYMNNASYSLVYTNFAWFCYAYLPPQNLNVNHENVI